MKDATLATVLGTCLAYAQDTELDGLLLAVAEVAEHLRSVSGQDAAERFLAGVRSASLRLLQAGLDIHGPIGPQRSSQTSLMVELTRIERSLGGSTSPSL